ncbi:AraC family transcriptional regulator [Streptomyces sp. NPDC047081]|uniref:AraC family transcriptional regulator n=1 Tax=Streptomyces sp. NPDC047081 TaxID=3154706 RepID=UPI0033D56896
MDLLSDVIAAMRMGRPHYARTERRAPWAVRHRPFAGAGFHLVLEGRSWLIPPGGSPIELRAGDIAFLPHGSAHSVAGDPAAPATDLPSSPLADPHQDDQSDGAGAGSRTVMLCGAYLMDRARPHPLLGEFPDFVHLPARLGQHSSLRGATDLLATELAEPRLGSDALLPALLDALLLYVMRAWLDERPRHDATTGWTAALHDPAVHAALQGIHGAPHRPWTVEELGALAGLSRAAFARRFTTLVGRPPLSYLTWWRMTTAARLLRDYDAPLKTVANRVGYTSEFAFGTAFKREHGLTPGAYRRQSTSADPGATDADRRATGSGERVRPEH